MRTGAVAIDEKQDAALKKVRITKFLTRDQLKQVEHLFRNPRTKISFAQRICDEVIKPNLEVINQKLGQPNDPMYLAYMVEYVMGLALRPRDVRIENGVQTTSFVTKGS